MEEEWIDVKNFEGLYQISNFGNARSLNYRRTGQIRNLKPGTDKDGYRYVCLLKDGLKKYFKIHRLVWESFNGPIPDGYEVNHQNEDKSDNRLVNLSIVSHKSNINWGSCSERAGEKHRKGVLQYGLDGSFIKRWKSESEAGETLGIDVGQISACCNNKPHYNTAGDYVWKFE